MMFSREYWFNSFPFLVASCSLHMQASYFTHGLKQQQKTRRGVKGVQRKECKEQREKRERKHKERGAREKGSKEKRKIRDK